MRALPWRPLPRETTHGPRRDGGTFTTSYDPGAALGDPGNIVTEPISLDPGHTRIVVRMLGSA